MFPSALKMIFFFLPVEYLMHHQANRDKLVLCYKMVKSRSALKNCKTFSVPALAFL